jgi:hypothetical protein
MVNLMLRMSFMIKADRLTKFELDELIHKLVPSSKAWCCRSLFPNNLQNFLAFELGGKTRRI